VRQGIGARETFAEFARLCREGGPQRCSLAALGDPAVVVPATFDRLARKPVEIALPDASTIVVTEQLAVATTFFNLYSPAGWPQLADLLASLAAPVPAPARVAAAAARTSSPLGARVRGEDYPSVGNAMASVCVDTEPSGQVREYPALADAADQEAPYFGRFRAWLGLPCEFWALQDRDAFHGRWQQSTRAPVLVIGTRFDPATPYRQARPYADLFPASRLLTLDGWGHTAIGKSACVDTAIAAYLVDGAPPQDGAHCAPDAVPFAARSGAPSAPRPDVPPGLPLW
jgi:pimeloyl-ACP methyl ester carboxylesterase